MTHTGCARPQCRSVMQSENIGICALSSSRPAAAQRHSHGSLDAVVLKWGYMHALRATQKQENEGDHEGGEKARSEGSPEEIIQEATLDGGGEEAEKDRPGRWREREQREGSWWGRIAMPDAAEEGCGCAMGVKRATPTGRRGGGRRMAATIMAMTTMTGVRVSLSLSLACLCVCLHAWHSLCLLGRLFACMHACSVCLPASACLPAYVSACLCGVYVCVCVCVCM